MSIADNIKKLRESHNLTQAQFGEIAGVSDKAVSTWENGTAEPRMGAIQKISQYFNISKGSLIDDAVPSSSAPQVPDLTSSEIQIVKKLHKLDNDDQLKVEGMIDSYLMDPKYKEKEKLA